MGHPFRARIGANESAFGPSPKAVAAIAAVAPQAWMYGDPECHDLRGALARHHGVAPENIVVGEGIDGLLGYLVRLTVAPGTPVVTSDGAYPTFDYHVAGHGGVLHKVPYRDDRADLEALLARADEVGARLVYVANPDNPMGSWHGADDVARAIASVPDGTLLVLDEAYAQFAPAPVAPPVDAGATSVIRLRTFSKAYGFAGMRVGYAIGDARLIAAFDRVRNHFGVGRVAQAAALAALADRAWLADVVARTAMARQRIADIAVRHGLAPLPSATNFVTVDCGGSADLARAVVARLADAGVFVRMPFAAPGNRCIRIGCGTEADLALLAAALPAALARAREEAVLPQERGAAAQR